MSSLQEHMNELLFTKSELSLLTYHIEKMIDNDYDLNTTPLHEALSSVYNAYEHVTDQYAEAHSILQVMEDHNQ